MRTTSFGKEQHQTAVTQELEKATARGGHWKGYLPTLKWTEQLSIFPSLIPGTVNALLEWSSTTYSSSFIIIVSCSLPFLLSTLLFCPFLPLLPSQSLNFYVSFPSLPSFSNMSLFSFLPFLPSQSFLSLLSLFPFIHSFNVVIFCSFSFLSLHLCFPYFPFLCVTGLSLSSSPFHLQHWISLCCAPLLIVGFKYMTKGFLFPWRYFWCC